MNRLTVDDLLKPRYKVIADYPNSGDMVGKVYEAETCRALDYYKKYPNIYKELAWYEERSEEEMPQFVKTLNDSNGLVINIEKVKGWAGCNQVVEFENGEEGATEYWMPATKEEYEFLKSQLKANNLQIILDDEVFVGYSKIIIY